MVSGALAEESSSKVAPLKGKAEYQSKRIPRPLLNALQDFAIPSSKQSAGSVLPQMVQTTGKKEESLFSKPDFNHTEKQSTFSAGAEDGITRIKSSSGTSFRQQSQSVENSQSRSSAAQSGVQTTASAPAEARKMLIRLKRFYSLSETEVVWEAARTGVRWLKKGADVTILLDMDAVHAANKNETANAWFEHQRGNGNTAGGKLTSPQDELLAFTSAGGKLVASERWARHAALSPSALVPGTTLLSDDAIDDLLIDPTTTVISY